MENSGKEHSSATVPIEVIRRKTRRITATALTTITILAALSAMTRTAHAQLRSYPAATRQRIGAVAQGTNIRANNGNGIDAVYNSKLAAEFNLIGGENDFKMYMWTGWNGDPMTGTPIINWNNNPWADQDAVANFAIAHGQRMRGHCLVYHSAVPAFLNPSGDNRTSPYTDAQIQSMVKKYITTVMQRYKNVIDYWDVTNENIDGNGNLSTTWTDYPPNSAPVTKNDFWIQHLGGTANYLKNVFTWARQADPHAELYYCDYGTEYPGAKFNGMLSTLKAARASGAPIDGVAFQCHENTNAPNNVLNSDNTRAVNEAGFVWQVTELDVQTDGANPDWGTQNSIYSRIANICTLDPNCHGMMMWGFTDRYSWLNPANGLIFDYNYVAKTGYWAIDYMYANAPLPVGSVATSSAIGGWPGSNLLDYKPGTVWSSNGHGTGNSLEWLAYWWSADHSSFKPINYVALWPRWDPVNKRVLSFPRSFTIYYSNGSQWIPIKTVTGLNPTRSEWVKIPLGQQVNANGIQIQCSDLGQDDNGAYYFQLSEASGGKDPGL